MRIIVSGLVGLHPVGGVAWDYLQYVLGFVRLGHDVYYHEDTWSWPYQPLERRQTKAATYSASYIKAFFDRYAPELSGNWHYRHLHESSHGMSQTRFDQVARDADMFVNVSGASLIPDALPANCVKVFVDTDPGYNQIVMLEKPRWSENVERWCAAIAAHDVHFTYAENIDGEDCRIPEVGYRWKKTRMPVVLDLWRDLRRCEPAAGAPWTTVMTWNAFKGPLIHRGIEYHSKDAEFEKFMSLPERAAVTMKVAVGGVDAPFGELRDRGWRAIDGPAATLRPDTYRQFIADSRAEFSIAKHVYVATRSGWFSCRSACYLAAGRPVVVQDTGFSAALPATAGLIAFDDLAGATDAIERVEGDWRAHSVAAQAVAEAHFSSDGVLADLLAQVNA